MAHVNLKLGDVIRVHFNEFYMKYTNKSHIDYTVLDIRRFPNFEVELLHENTNSAFWFSWQSNFEILNK